MNASDQLARATPYVERLLADDNAQDHLARPVSSLRRGSELAQHRGVAGAISDRQAAAEAVVLVACRGQS